MKAATVLTSCGVLTCGSTLVRSLGFSRSLVGFPNPNNCMNAVLRTASWRSVAGVLGAARVGWLFKLLDPVLKLPLLFRRWRQIASFLEPTDRFRFVLIDCQVNRCHTPSKFGGHSALWFTGRARKIDRLSVVLDVFVIVLQVVICCPQVHQGSHSPTGVWCL